VIRLLEPRDIDAVLTIQSACPEIARWTAWDYGRVAHGEMAGWVAEKDASVSAFLVARRIADDLEILNFAVAPRERRQGIGATLLQEAFAWGRTFNAREVLLEVRTSNTTALQFYERHGFTVAGRRKQYYVAPIEDALVLVRPIEQLP